MHGIETVFAISLRYSSEPKNHFGSVSTEMQSAPAFSYSLAISRYLKSGSISPLDGEAFLHSHMKQNHKAFRFSSASRYSSFPQGLFFSCPLPRETLNILQAGLKYSSLFLSCFVCLAVAYLDELIECFKCFS